MVNILFLHVDALRFDWAEIKHAISSSTLLHGFEILEQQFIKVSNCWTSSTCTLSSVCSYMTSQFPYVSGVRSNDIGRINPDVKTFPKLLKDDYEYITKALISTGYKHISNWNRTNGLQGFDELEFVYDLTNPQEQQGRSTQLIKRINEFANFVNSGDRKFLYVQLLDMHGWDGRDKNGYPDEYIQGMKNVDVFLYNFLRKIDLDNTVIVVLGDHGWRLPIDDKTYNYCIEPKGMSLLEPLCKVGCYLHFPKLFNADIDSSITCRTIDIWPTVFNILNYSYSEDVEGKSLQSFEGCVLEDNRLLYAEHVEWLIKRNPKVCEPLQKEIPLLNYAIGNKDWTLLMDAIKDLPQYLFKTSQYDSPVVNREDVINDLVSDFLINCNSKSKFIQWNKEHIVENSNEFVRDKLQENLI